MTNRLRTEVEEEELVDRKLIVDENPVKDVPDNFFMQFLKNGVITTDDATRALPFVLYVAFLGMLYIGNRHMSENNLRDIDKIGKEVKELSWEFKSSKAELAFKSTQTEVAKRADTLGIRAPQEPPQKITAQEDDMQE
jgi:hypothetical protein